MTCAFCSTEIPNCIACNPSLRKCLRCEPNYYLKNGVCDECLSDPEYTPKGSNDGTGIFLLNLKSISYSTKIKFISCLMRERAYFFKKNFKKVFALNVLQQTVMGAPSKMFAPNVSPPITYTQIAKEQLPVTPASLL